MDQAGTPGFGAQCYFTREFGVQQVRPFGMLFALVQIRHCGGMHDPFGFCSFEQGIQLSGFQEISRKHINPLQLERVMIDDRGDGMLGFLSH
jgi:hypothetical protein